VLWSLFVEVQFYILAGLLFFNIKKFDFIAKLFALALSFEFFRITLILIGSQIGESFDAVLPLHSYIWWFLAGSTFYEMLTSRKSIFLHSTAIISIIFNLLSLNHVTSGFRLNLVPSAISLISYAIFYLLIMCPEKIAFFEIPHTGLVRRHYL
jgi:peptidoglycan/LPS O-acetylase OafA/YrhL